MNQKTRFSFGASNCSCINLALPFCFFFSRFNIHIHHDATDCGFFIIIFWCLADTNWYYLIINVSTYLLTNWLINYYWVIYIYGTHRTQTTHTHAPTHWHSWLRKKTNDESDGKRKKKQSQRCHYPYNKLLFPCRLDWIEVTFNIEAIYQNVHIVFYRYCSAHTDTYSLARWSTKKGNKKDL